MNKYLVKIFEVDIDIDRDADYYPVGIIENVYIDASSPKEAFEEFVKRLENNDRYGFYDVRYDLIEPLANFEEDGYAIELYCTWYDLGIYDEPTKLSAVVEQVKGEEVKKYLIENTFIHLDKTVDYCEFDAIPSRCIEARSEEEALLVFIESLERDEELGYYDIKHETLRLLPCLETTSYLIDGACTWVDADCYTHDDGPVELTFTVTEVHDMIPEEL